MDYPADDAILRDIATHGNACKALRDHGLDPAQFYPRLAVDEVFFQKYARAKSAGCNAYADETIDIADGCEESQESVAKARLRVDTRKWHLSKLLPKVYGDRLELDHKGEGFAITIKPPEKTG
jgi:hypothetical protein